MRARNTPNHPPCSGVGNADLPVKKGVFYDPRCEGLAQNITVLTLANSPSTALAQYALARRIGLRETLAHGRNHSAVVGLAEDRTAGHKRVGTGVGHAADVDRKSVV